MSYSFSQQRWHISDISRTRESPLLFSLRLHSSVLRSLARVSGANIEAIWPWGPAFPRNLGKHRLEMQTQSTRWMMPSCSAPFYYFYYCHSGLWVPAQKNKQKQKTNQPKYFPGWPCTSMASWRPCLFISVDLVNEFACLGSVGFDERHLTHKARPLFVSGEAQTQISVTSTTALSTLPCLRL